MPEYVRIRQWTWYCRLHTENHGSANW